MDLLIDSSDDNGLITKTGRQEITVIVSKNLSKALCVDIKRTRKRKPLILHYPFNPLKKHSYETP